MARRFIIVVAAVLTLVSVSSAVAQSPPSENGGISTRIDICHATGQPTTPYALITINASELEQHRGHPGDIIPAPGGTCPATTSNTTNGLVTDSFILYVGPPAAPTAVASVELPITAAGPAATNPAPASPRVASGSGAVSATAAVAAQAAAPQQSNTQIQRLPATGSGGLDEQLRYGAVTALAVTIAGGMLTGGMLGRRLKGCPPGAPDNF